MIAWWCVGCQLIWSLKDSLGDTGIHFIQQLLHILNTVSKALQFSSTLVCISWCTVKKQNKTRSWLSQHCWQWRWRHMLFIPVCWDLEAWSKYKPWEWQPKQFLFLTNEKQFPNGGNFFKLLWMATVERLTRKMIQGLFVFIVPTERQNVWS